jgi:hypothetical protein
VARRGVALSALGAGIIVIVVARSLIPSAPPLYDGVVPLERYLWLDPPPGHPGGAKGATAEIQVKGGKSPFIAVATPELEPQAQIVAQPGALTLPPGTRRIKVSIQPVPTEGVPADGHIDGNVYRITVTDGNGAPLTAPASALVSVVMRGTDPTLDEATIARFSNGSWQPLKKSSAGFGATFLAVVTGFGDFAVIAPGPGSSVSVSEAPAAAATASLAQSPAAILTSGAPSGSESSSQSAADAADLPGWLIPGLAATAVVVLILGYRATRRGRRDDW